MPVLIGGARYEDGASQGVAFVFDVTERKGVGREALHWRGALPWRAPVPCA